MRLIHFTLQPRAPVGTPLRGDTLLGHLVWQYAYAHGQEAMEEFFERVASNPPACSDLFPEGKLPIPLMPLKFEKGEAKDRKKHKDVKLLPVETIKKLQDGLSEKALADAIMAAAKTSEEKYYEGVSTLHASINRLTGTTTEESASLYARPVTHYGKTKVNEQDGNKSVEPINLHGYLAPGALGNHDEVKELLKRAGDFGYGADASSGLGVFTVESFSEEELFVPANANAWMSLSRHLTDTECNPHKAYYGIETHYGRLGGALANTGNVFKHPLLLCAAGGLWPGWKDSVRGGMLEHVVTRDDVNIRHLGYTIPLAFHMREEFK